MESLSQFLLSGKSFLNYCQLSITVCVSLSMNNCIVFLFLCPLGNIRNTERLSYDKQQSYKIMVTAFDCGQKRAKEDVAVHIDVKPVCKPGWQGQR